MNKETLQSYNSRLNTNNASLNDVLEIVNGLTEIKGTLDITENGTYDVKQYAEATVNVESSGRKMPPATISLTPAVYRLDYSDVASVTTNAVSIMNSNASSSDTGDTSTIVLPSIVVAYVRSDYTLSDNLELIAETGWSTASDGTTQKLVVCWCDDANKDFTITQASSGRMGVGLVSFQSSQKPMITVTLNECDYGFATGDTLPLKKGLTMYFATGIYSSNPAISFYKNSEYNGNMPTPMRRLSEWNGTYLTKYGASARLGMFAYYTEDDCETLLTGYGRSDSDLSIIGITCE